MRQKIRKGILTFSALLFPLTFFFLSPYLIVLSATQGIVGGSAMVFFGMFILSIVTSRLYCGWLCPGGAMQDTISKSNDRRWNGKGKNLSKYIIWAVWFGFIVCLWIKNKPLTDDAMFKFEIDPQYLIVYVAVVTIIFLFTLFTGKRGMCHSFCWMAPFMIVGEKLADLLHIPRFRLKVDPGKCISCGKCAKACPMGLSIDKMVKSGKTDSTECISCLECVDACPNGAIRCGIYAKQR
ncbi:MAG: 4Fe-4S binding protein [Clostridiales bacterium]|nr:4Fe-4S binding protein [Clostridiales bacterium]